MGQSAIRRFFNMSVDINDYFSKEELAEITAKIKEAERTHTAELAVVIETERIKKLGGKRLTPFQRALECFGLYGVWDTEENLGILIYVNLCEREIQIVTDRGLRDCFDNDLLNEYCSIMVNCFKNGAYFKGLTEVMDKVNARIAEIHPRTGEKEVNELADDVIVN